MNTKKAKELRKIVYGKEYSHADRLFISMSPLVDISRRSLYKIGKKMFKRFGNFEQFKKLLPQLMIDRESLEKEHKKRVASFLEKISKSQEKISDVKSN